MLIAAPEGDEQYSKVEFEMDVIAADTAPPREPAEHREKVELMIVANCSL